VCVSLTSIITWLQIAVTALNLAIIFLVWIITTLFEVILLFVMYTRNVFYYCATKNS